MTRNNNFLQNSFSYYLEIKLSKSQVLLQLNVDVIEILIQAIISHNVNIFWMKCHDKHLINSMTLNLCFLKILKCRLHIAIYHTTKEIFNSNNIFFYFHEYGNLLRNRLWLTKNYTGYHSSVSDFLFYNIWCF